jgi:hypothetical protein
MSQDKVKTELQPHVHAEVIKAWAMGEQIQFSFNGTEWEDCNLPTGPNWDIRTLYRVKPKPQKNIELYASAELEKETNTLMAISSYELIGCFDTRFISTDNLKLTFCGVTGKLLLAEVVVHPSAGEDDNDF